MPRPRKTPRIDFSPPLSSWPTRGVYQLCFHLSASIKLTVGRFGTFVLPPGKHIYIGRASRGLVARVKRHATGPTRKHWHIDYLRCAPGVMLTRISLLSDDPEDECPISQRIGRRAHCLIPRFGAGDCRAGCLTHLWYLPEDDDVRH